MPVAIPAITHLHVNLRLRLHLLFPNVELAHLSGRLTGVRNTAKV